MVMLTAPGMKFEFQNIAIQAIDGSGWSKTVIGLADCSLKFEFQIV